MPSSALRDANASGYSRPTAVVRNDINIEPRSKKYWHLGRCRRAIEHRLGSCRALKLLWRLSPVPFLKTRQRSSQSYLAPMTASDWHGPFCISLRRRPICVRSSRRLMRPTVGLDSSGSASPELASALERGQNPARSGN